MFPVTVLTNVTYWDYDIYFFLNKRLEIFVNMGHYGSENFKTFELLQ